MSDATERCIGYAACSELLASPHDVDVPALLAARLDSCAHLTALAGLGAAARDLLQHEATSLRDAYSALFEVGDEGPPLPIRASLHPQRSPAALEEVVRFYDYFQYGVGARHAWQPDHLSVMLEFMHWLSWREASAAADAASLRLAQADFAERHLLSWLPALAAAAGEAGRDTPYAPVLRAVLDFVTADVAALRAVRR